MRKETKTQIVAVLLLIMVLFIIFLLIGCSFLREKEKSDYRPDMTPAAGDSNDVLIAKKDMFAEQLEKELNEKKAELAEATKREKQTYYRRYELLFILGLAGGILAAVLLKSKITGLAAVLSCATGIAAIELLKIEWPVWMQITASIGALTAVAYGVYAVVIHDNSFFKVIKGGEKFKAAAVPSVIDLFRVKQRESQTEGSATEKLVAKYREQIIKDEQIEEREKTNV